MIYKQSIRPGHVPCGALTLIPQPAFSHLTFPESTCARRVANTEETGSSTVTCLSISSPGGDSTIRSNREVLAPSSAFSANIDVVAFPSLDQGTLLFAITKCGSRRLSTLRGGEGEFNREPPRSPNSEATCNMLHSAPCLNVEDSTFIWLIYELFSARVTFDYGLILAEGSVPLRCCWWGVS